MKCTGRESYLTDCQYTEYTPEDPRTLYECVHVSCQEKPSVADEMKNYFEGLIKIDPYRSLLSIYHAGVWGNVCHSNFNKAAADVACR